MTDTVRRALERDRKQIAAALDESIEETIRQAWLPNTVAWVLVVGLGLAVNLLVLAVVAGS